MTKRYGALLVALMTTFTIGCSSSGSGGNAAAGKTFTYGSPTSASSSQAGVLSTSVTSALSLKDSPSASGAMNVVNFQGVTQSLLGTSGLGSLGSLSPEAAAQSASLTNALTRAQAGRAAIEDEFETCATENAAGTEVTFNCTATDSSSGMTITLRGFVRADVATSTATLTWNLTMTASTTASGQTVNVTFTYSGALTATETSATTGTIVGHMDASISVSAGGQQLAMDESLILDITFDEACDSGVTEGTLEAKRVITAWPTGSGAPARPEDAAAKVEWTACGVGQIWFSN